MQQVRARRLPDLSLRSPSYPLTPRPPQTEIDATVACFGEQERAEASRLASRAYARRSSEEESSPPPQFAASSTRGQQDAILRAINAMPSSAGLALTRGDLQETLNNAYREGLTTSPGAPSVTTVGEVPIIRSREADRVVGERASIITE